MAKKQARVYEIDWKTVASGATELPNSKVLDAEYDALVLHLHTEKDFIDAMHKLKGWRIPEVSGDPRFDKPIIVVHDDALDIKRIGPDSQASSEAHEAYLTYLTKKFGPDATFSKSVFEKSMGQSSEPTLIHKIIAVNQPSLKKLDPANIRLTRTHSSGDFTIGF